MLAASFHTQSLYVCLKILKVAPAVKKIFQRVMSGTKGAAKALQGALNVNLLMQWIVIFYL